MTYYREIDVVQEPFDNGVGEDGLQMIIFNIDCVCRPTTAFLEEIISILVAAGVGTLGTDIFAGASTRLPPGDLGPLLTVTETGGFAPERTHNSVATPAYQRPSASLIFRAGNDEDRDEPNGYKAARAMARTAYLALVGVRNKEVTV